MAHKNRCRNCGRPLGARALTCDHCHPEPTPGTAVQFAHLGCETISQRTRQRVLRRMANARKAGVRDPELLYAGARYAASLALTEECCAFLDPLSEMLSGGNGRAPAFLPVGMLYLTVLEPGE